MREIGFIQLLDMMKVVYRSVPNIYNDRRENDAEHTYMMFVCAIVLKPYINLEVDMEHVFKIIAFHDVPEIYAGDECAYTSNIAPGLKYMREVMAVYHIKTETKYCKFQEYWREYEKGLTNEAKYAKIIDKIQPFILITGKQGFTFTNYKATRVQIYNRLKKYLKDDAPKLWEYVKSELKRL
jgi:putative hydrolase of HD superfamily